MVPLRRLRRHQQKIVEANWLYRQTAVDIAKFFMAAPAKVRIVLVEAGPGVFPVSKLYPVALRALQLRVCKEHNLDCARAREVRYNYAKHRDAAAQSIIRDYTDYGLPVYSIALFHNCSPMTVWRVLKRHNVRTRPRGAPRKEKALNG